MPRYELIDCRSTAYRCDTQDPWLLRGWLAEWLPRLADPDYPPRMRVMPLVKGPDLADGFDWPADNRFIGYDFGIGSTPDEAIAAIEAQRRDIERKIREAS